MAENNTNNEIDNKIIDEINNKIINEGNNNVINDTNNKTKKQKRQFTSGSVSLRQPSLPL